jgi:hypothetical protein
MYIYASLATQEKDLIEESEKVRFICMYIWVAVVIPTSTVCLYICIYLYVHVCIYKH